MSRYIDADKLMEITFKNEIGLTAFHNIIKRQPTADVVEVVRCKECIWHLKDDSCARLYCITDDVFYCWHGRREENE